MTITDRPTTSHMRRDPQTSPAGGGDTSAVGDQRTDDSQSLLVATGTFDPCHDSPASHDSCAGDDDGGRGWLELRIWAESFHDLQESRKAIANRLRLMPPEIYKPQLDAMMTAERVTRLAMIRNYRRTAPAGIIEWQRRTAGIGEPLLARLLGHLGHPRIAQPYYWEGTGTSRTLWAAPSFERSIGQLWQYCGHGDPTRRRHKGMTQADALKLGNPILKPLVWNLAVAAMKQIPRDHSLHETQGSTVAGAFDQLEGEPLHPDPARGATHICSVGVEQPVEPGHDEPATQWRRAGLDYRYRELYELRRLHTADRVHAIDCVRCGPSGHPAPAGTPWSAGHQHADAIRIVGKEILRDLWLAAG